MSRQNLTIAGHGVFASAESIKSLSQIDLNDDRNRRLDRLRDGGFWCERFGSMFADRGLHLFGATLLYKANASASARMRGRLVLNGPTVISGSFGEISATHVSLAPAIWLQTTVPFTAGDTVEL